jgi:hypothetical protein
LLRWPFNARGLELKCLASQTNSGVGGAVNVYVSPVNSVKVGDLKQKNCEIQVSRVPQSAPLVGQSFWGDHRYVIDSEKMLIRFAR